MSALIARLVLKLSMCKYLCGFCGTPSHYSLEGVAMHCMARGSSRTGSVKKAWQAVGPGRARFAGWCVHIVLKIAWSSCAC